MHTKLLCVSEHILCHHQINYIVIILSTFCSAIEQMILRNPENAKITNEYLYNLLHTGALYGRKDIVSIAIDKVMLIVPLHV